MATSSLGSLVVSLGLNAAEFVTGLSKAELQSKRFAANLSNEIAIGVAKAQIAMEALGAAARTALNAIPDLINKAGGFQDLAEKTGASAEQIASFAVAAKVAGVSAESIAGMMQKLAKNLLGVDDEGKAAGAALKALGLDIAAFKQLTPDQQILTLAKTLDQFQDGAAKTGVQMALLGKAGGEAGPLFKELANGAGQVVILNDQLIKQADEYADKQARTKAELDLYAQVIAVRTIPAITSLTTVTKDFIKELLGIQTESGKLRDDNRIGEWANNVIKALAFVVDSGQGVGRVFQIVGETIGAGAAQAYQIATGNFAAARAIGQDWQRQVQNILQQQLFSQRLGAEITRKQKEDRLRAQEDRGFTPDFKKKLNFDGAVKDAKGDGDKLSDAERLLNTLKKQLETTEGLSTEEKTLREIQSGRVKGLTPDLEAQILATARTIDMYKKLEEEIQKMKQRWEEEAKAAEDAVRAQAKLTEDAQKSAEEAAKTNEELRDEIAIILGGENARKALERDYLARAIARKEDALAAAQQKINGQLEAEAIRLEIEALREREGLLSGRDLAVQLKKEADELQNIKDLFSDAFANAFTDFINGTKSASEAFKSFERDIVSAISRIAAQNLANALFGGKNGGSSLDIGSIFTKLLGGLFGGSSGGTPPMFPGNMGADFLTPGFASGGVSRGGMAWVGENGPEKVYLPPGARVVSSDRSGTRSGHVFNITVPVMPGATTASAKQQANMIRDTVLKSIRER